MKKIFECCSNSQEETEKLGAVIADLLKPGDILTFVGELGAGKTCFIRGIASGLGIHANITSSSFVLLRPFVGRLPLYHFDFYRLESPDELEDIGYEEFIFSTGVSVIEWPEKAGDLLGDEKLVVELRYDEEEPARRHITFTPHGTRAEEIVSQLAQEERNV